MSENEFGNRFLMEMLHWAHKNDLKDSEGQML